MLFLLNHKKVKSNLIHIDIANVRLTDGCWPTLMSKKNNENIATKEFFDYSLHQLMLLYMISLWL